MAALFSSVKTSIVSCNGQNTLDMFYEVDLIGMVTRFHAVIFLPTTSQQWLGRYGYVFRKQEHVSGLLIFRPLQK